MVIDIFEGGGYEKEMVSRILISRGWHIRCISNNITTVVKNNSFKSAYIDLL